MPKLDLKPGDMIEWIYSYSGKVVPQGEKIYSSAMKQWVPIWKPSLLISIDDETYSWLNPDGFFYARRDEAWGMIGAAGSSGPEWKQCKFRRKYDMI